MRKEQILQLLQNAGGYLSGEQMSQELGISRAAVWKAVQALRSEGVQIDSVTNRGYRLRDAGTGLSLARVLAALGEQPDLQPHPWRELIAFQPEVDSTNNVLKIQAAAGAPEGTVLVADRQTAGRGRLGRSFASPAGVGVYLSVILRPTALPTQLGHLTALAAVAVCDAVEAVCGIRPGIKWTNDPVIGKRKVSGILTELSLEAESGSVQYAIVGIGVNCNHQEADFPPEVQPMATSLAIETGHPVDRSLIAAELIRALYRMNKELLTGKAAWLQRYERDCITLGKEVRIVRGDEIRYAQAIGLDEDAGLRVRYLDTGAIDTVSSGEVSVRGMYGYV